MICLTTGCAATLKPPPDPVDPVPVVVLDHGRHNTLVIVPEPNRAIRYAYGEWRWYVDGQTGSGRALGALLSPSPAALGRRILEGPVDPNCWQPQVGSVIRRALVFRASSEAASRLVEAIDRYFEQADYVQFSYRLKLELIEDPIPYSLSYNSNHRVVEWLKALGFSMRGNPTIGRLNPADPQSALSIDSSACSASSHWFSR